MMELGGGGSITYTEDINDKNITLLTDEIRRWIKRANKEHGMESLRIEWRAIPANEPKPSKEFSLDNTFIDALMFPPIERYTDDDGMERRRFKPLKKPRWCRYCGSGIPEDDE